ncbi:MAG: hypothetical protein ACYC5N_05000 [Endomicrobiales bacterium]
MKMERAVFITCAGDLEKKSGRVYYGNEFCENLIPAESAARKWYDASRARGKEFTFVTPYATDKGVGKLRKVFKALDRAGGAEVVFNDWGVFQALREFPGLVPVLGRLLTKQRRDPRILRIFQGRQGVREDWSADRKSKTLFFPRPCPPELFEHYRGSVVNLPRFQRFLRENNIRRVEIDNLAWDMKVAAGEGLAVSVYVPFGYLTTTRLCGILNYTYSACRKECKRMYFKLNDPSLPVPFFSRGNAVFFKTPVPSKDYLRARGIDRVVCQPHLPFQE